MTIDRKTIDILSGVTTATITTVLLKHGLRNVWMRQVRPLRPGSPRLVGPAFTLRFVPAREDLATPASWASPRSTRLEMEGHTTQFAVAWPTVPLQSGDIHPLDVASFILSHGDTSRLVKRLMIDEPLPQGLAGEQKFGEAIRKAMGRWRGG